MREGAAEAETAAKATAVMVENCILIVWDWYFLLKRKVKCLLIGLEVCLK